MGRLSGGGPPYDSDMNRHAITRGSGRAGRIRPWLILALVTGITAILVRMFVINLPGPPRFDPLTIEPGSEAGERGHFGVTLLLRDSPSSADRAWRTRTFGFVDGRPGPVNRLDGLDLQAGEWTYICRVPLARAETTPATLLFETHDAWLVVRSEEAVILEGGGEGSALTTSNSLLLPVGAGELVVEVKPLGPRSSLAGSWHPPGEPNERRNLRSLTETDSGRISD